MNSETDVKGSSKLDYIHLDYKDEPKNTLLKLHPGTGQKLKIKLLIKVR